MSHFYPSQNCCLTRRSAGERGKAIVEFVLVAPVVLFISMYTLRLVQMLQANEIAMVISREMATEMYRSCADIMIQQTTSCGNGQGSKQNGQGGQQNAPEICINESATKTAVNDCLEGIRVSWQDRWGDIKPGSAGDATWTLELYIYNMRELQSDFDPNASKGQQQRTCPQNPNGTCDRLGVSDAQNATLSKAGECLTGNTTDTYLNLPEHLISVKDFCERKRIARARISFPITPIRVFAFLGTVLPNQVTISDETII